MASSAAPCVAADPEAGRREVAGQNLDAAAQGLGPGQLDALERGPQALPAVFDVAGADQAQDRGIGLAQELEEQVGADEAGDAGE